MNVTTIRPRDSFTLAAVLLSACWADETPLDPVAAHEEELEIQGTRTDSTGTTMGALNITLLHRDLVSACYEEVNEELPGICDSTTRGRIDTGDCQSHLCMQQLYACVGHLLMQMADEVDEFELTTQRVKVSGQGDFMRQTVGSVTYSIPPQSAANRTLVYRLAGKAFATSGERAVTAITDTGCMTQIMESYEEPDESTTIPNNAETFAVTYADVVQAYTEATYKMTDNQVRVAGEKGQTVRDYTQSREAM